MKIINSTTTEVLFSQPVLADSLFKRMIGLMGKKSLPQEEAWWFTNCNAIQTTFMNFPIDCIFLDSKGTVLKIYHELKPWRLAGPIWKASVVIEAIAGSAKKKNIAIGDLIQCGH
jgi:uncharacterized protein